MPKGHSLVAAMHAQSARRGRSVALAIDRITGTADGRSETLQLTPGLALSVAQSQIATALGTTVDKVTFTQTYKYVYS